MTRALTVRNYVDQWLSGEASPPPVVELIGIRLIGYTEGEGKAALPAGKRHHNAMGTVHGGVLCDLADVAIGGAVVSTLNEGESFTTLGLQIEYYHGVVESLLTATAKVVKRGSSVVFCSCRIEDAEGNHVAQMNSTCLIRKPRS
ncbi:PaaI family thioesterase [Corallococcus silvisoli]|uniref:PaaI family thioesterase n=1 Tax=Corallococcus silvisoli TaxID=2697031 RepID=UPI0013766AE6|nr:PaaI family thioesterase [Corallococcus silvisoli]NBD13078.1 hotdog fold thioesterase [Corallococcus silvisoli]